MMVYREAIFVYFYHLYITNVRQPYITFKYRLFVFLKNKTVVVLCQEFKLI